MVYVCIVLDTNVLLSDTASADQPVLGTFLASNAKYLVTGDKDLLALSPLYSIIKPADFWQLHGN